MERSVIWKPTTYLRWKKVEIDELKYTMVLQQLWEGYKGDEEWRDIDVV